MQMVTGDVRSLAEGQIIDPSSEISIGQAIAQKVAERFGKIDDKGLEDRLERILKKLTLVSDRPDRELRYKVLLIDVPMVNALTLPGGTILMFRGLIDLVKNKMGELSKRFPEGHGSHATPSEIAVTYAAYPHLARTADLEPRIAPTGPIRDALDFRHRYPDGRMGANSALATVDIREEIIAAAVDGLLKDISEFEGR